MGDFNIDLNACTNSKFLFMLQIIDITHFSITCFSITFTQFVREPTRVTQTSETLIDHVYSSNPENITDCFVQ